MAGGLGVDEFVERLSAACPQAPAAFDAAFYLSQFPPELARTLDPMRHYWAVGWRAPLAPHVCFDLELLLGRQPAEPPSGEARPAMAPALLAILEARTPPYASPNVLFEPELYARHLPSRALGSLAPFEHFLRFWPDYRVPFSRYFDVDFYGMTHRHLRKAGLNPLVHYFSQPVEARSDPNPMIHGKFYALSQTRVRGDPLVHYVRYGLAAGCMPNPYAEQEMRLSASDGTRTFQSALLDDYVGVVD